MVVTVAVVGKVDVDVVLAVNFDAVVVNGTVEVVVGSLVVEFNGGVELKTDVVVVAEVLVVVAAVVVVVVVVLGVVVVVAVVVVVVVVVTVVVVVVVARVVLSGNTHSAPVIL